MMADIPLASSKAITTRGCCLLLSPPQMAMTAIRTQLRFSCVELPTQNPHRRHLLLHRWLAPPGGRQGGGCAARLPAGAQCRSRPRTAACHGSRCWCSLAPQTLRFTDDSHEWMSLAHVVREWQDLHRRVESAAQPYQQECHSAYIRCNSRYKCRITCGRSKVAGGTAEPWANTAEAAGNAAGKCPVGAGAQAGVVGHHSRGCHKAVGCYTANGAGPCTTTVATGSTAAGPARGRRHVVLVACVGGAWGWRVDARKVGRPQRLGAEGRLLGGRVLAPTLGHRPRRRPDVQLWQRQAARRGRKDGIMLADGLITQNMHMRVIGLVAERDL